MAHSEGSQILAQVHRGVAAYSGVTQNSSRQSPKQSSVVFACSEEGLYLVAFQSPFQWNQAGYFLVVKASKELWRRVLEKSPSTLSQRVSFREQRGGTCHTKGSYGSYLDLGYKSAKAILLTSSSELLLRDWICSKDLLYHSFGMDQRKWFKTRER